MLKAAIQTNTVDIASAVRRNQGGAELRVALRLCVAASADL